MGRGMGRGRLWNLPQGLGGSQEHHGWGAAAGCDAELLHLMPNLSHPLQTDNKLIFLGPETRILRGLEGERRCFGLLPAHREG